jgi:hypothetical protein
MRADGTLPGTCGPPGTTGERVEHEESGAPVDPIKELIGESDESLADPTGRGFVLCRHNVPAIPPEAILRSDRTSRLRIAWSFREDGRFHVTCTETTWGEVLLSADLASNAAYVCGLLLGDSVRRRIEQEPAVSKGNKSLSIRANRLIHWSNRDPTYSRGDA